MRFCFLKRAIFTSGGESLFPKAGNAVSASGTGYLVFFLGNGVNFAGTVVVERLDRARRFDLVLGYGRLRNSRLIRLGLLFLNRYSGFFFDLFFFRFDLLTPLPTLKSSSVPLFFFLILLFKFAEHFCKLT